MVVAIGFASAAFAQNDSIYGETYHREAGTIEGIDVVGHADPIGGAAYNQRLSEARAETVRRVMLDLGVASQLVHASGRGSNEPLVQCNSGSRSQRIVCNEPNRRVELLIRGARSDQ
nr:OmpA family protein [Pseudomonas nitroreducens]